MVCRPSRSPCRERPRAIDALNLTADETRDLCADDASATVFAPKERLILRLCDELHATANVSDELWTALAREWSPEQLVELVVLAGHYHAISFATNAFRLPLEPLGARFPPAEERPAGKLEKT